MESTTHEMKNEIKKKRLLGMNCKKQKTARHEMKKKKEVWDSGCMK